MRKHKAKTRRLSVANGDARRVSSPFPSHPGAPELSKHLLWTWWSQPRRWRRYVLRTIVALLFVLQLLGPAALYSATVGNSQQVGAARQQACATELNSRAARAQTIL